MPFVVKHLLYVFYPSDTLFDFSVRCAEYYKVGKKDVYALLEDCYVGEEETWDEYLQPRIGYADIKFERKPTQGYTPQEFHNSKFDAYKLRRERHAHILKYMFKNTSKLIIDKDLSSALKNKLTRKYFCL